jgi:hypothetical protein
VTKISLKQILNAGRHRCPSFITNLLINLPLRLESFYRGVDIFLRQSGQRDIWRLKRYVLIRVANGIYLTVVEVEYIRQFQRINVPTGAEETDLRCVASRFMLLEQPSLTKAFPDGKLARAKVVVQR